MEEQFFDQKLLWKYFLELSGGPLGHKYKLEQFHCHWGCTSSKGSEHTVDGIPYAGEVSGFQTFNRFPHSVQLTLKTMT